MNPSYRSQSLRRQTIVRVIRTVHSSPIAKRESASSRTRSCGGGDQAAQHSGLERRLTCPNHSTAARFGRRKLTVITYPSIKGKIIRRFGELRSSGGCVEIVYDADG